MLLFTVIKCLKLKGTFSQVYCCGVAYLYSLYIPLQHWMHLYTQAQIYIIRTGLHTLLCVCVCEAACVCNTFMSTHKHRYTLYALVYRHLCVCEDACVCVWAHNINISISMQIVIEEYISFLGNCKFPLIVQFCP